MMLKWFVLAAACGAFGAVVASQRAAAQVPQETEIACHDTFVTLPLFSPKGEYRGFTSVQKRAIVSMSRYIDLYAKDEDEKLARLTVIVKFDRPVRGSSTLRLASEHYAPLLHCIDRNG